MIDLFKQEKKPKGQIVYRVQNLNKEKGITSTMRVSKNGKRYTTVLCLPNATLKRVFFEEKQALGIMNRYKILYKKKDK